MKCKECDGTGKVDYCCGMCGGSGEGMADGTTCQFCKGNGCDELLCEDCDGSGEFEDGEDE